MIKKYPLSLRSFIFSYLMVLIPAILITNILFYTLFIPSYENEIRTINQDSLLSIKMVLDQFVIRPIDEIHAEIIVDQNQIGYIKPIESGEPPNLWELYSIYDWLGKLLTKYPDLFHGISIYYQDKALIISSEGFKYLNEKDNNNLSFYWSESLNFPNKNMWTSGELEYQYIGAEKKQVITNIKAIPYAEKIERKGAIIFDINASYINSLLQEKHDVNHYSFHIINMNGDVIFNSGEKLSQSAISRLLQKPNSLEKITQFSESGIMFSAVPAAEEEFFYVFSVPKSTYFQRSQLIKKQIIAIATFILFISFVLIIWVSKKTYNPILRISNTAQNILEAFNEPLQMKNDYEKIHYTMNKLDQRVKGLGEKLNQNRAIIKYNFFNLLIQKQLDQDEIKQRMEFLQLELSHPYYSVAIVYLDENEFDIEANEMVRYGVVEIIEKMNTSSIFAYGITQGAYHIVAFYNYEIEVEIYKCLNNIETYLCSELKIDPSHYTLSCGKAYNLIEEISTSYKEAKKLIPYHFINPRSILEESKIGPRTNDYHVINFDQENFKILLNTLNEKQIYIFFEQLILDIQKNKLSVESAKEICLEILTITKSTLYQERKLVDNQIFEQLFEEYHQIKTIYQFADCYMEFIEALKRQLVIMKKNQYDEQIIKIEKFIKNNYNDDISLRSLAEDFHIGYAHLSKRFKEVTGSSFTLYLNQYRIEESQKMLRESQMTIEEISKKVGFRESGYYIRQFKKYTGMTPGQYRLKT